MDKLSENFHFVVNTTIPYKAIPTTQKGNPERTVTDENKNSKVKDTIEEKGEQNIKEEEKINEEGKIKEEKKEEEWEVPKDWDDAVRLYGKYSLFFIMFVQVLWVVFGIGQFRHEQRKIIAKIESLQPINIDNVNTTQN